MDLRRAAAVAAGAALGTTLRWVVMWFYGPAGLDGALLTVNLVGCLMLGFIVEIPPPNLHRALAAFLTGGICAGLTTWSSLAVRSAHYLRRDAWSTGIWWLGLNVVLGVAAAVLGRSLGRGGLHRVGAEPERQH